MGDNFLASTTVVRWERSTRVRIRSLRKLLTEWRPTILCVDVEGSEIDLFDGGLPEFVDRVVLELHESLYGPRGIRHIFDVFTEMGFVYVPNASSYAVLAFQRQT